MELHRGESCMACIVRHVGPAVDTVSTDPVKTARCGGCGQVVGKHRFTYWFPWPEGDE